MKQRQTPAHGPAWRRRDFLSTGASAAAAIALTSSLPGKAQALTRWSSAARMTGAEDITQAADQQRMEQLVLRAIDAARGAGAQYAEARVTRTVVQYIGTDIGVDSERYTIGVRALVGGAWGFASSTYWEMDEAATLAKDAVAQARINASAFPRQIELGSYPVAKGKWVTPIRIDPFQISPEEKRDFFRSLEGRAPRYVSHRKYSLGVNNARLYRQERVTATSEGALFSQTLYESGGEVMLYVIGEDPQTKRSDRTGISVRGIGPTAAGWELFLDAKIREQIPSLAEEAEHNLFLDSKPVDVGRYEVVVSAGVTSSFIAQTLGNATQLDRAVGMEANAGGTSYLGPDPNDHLGTTLGAPILTVTANRSMPKGLATVKWDDEGVEPDIFPIIQGGTFVDYQTTREQASWLAPWYQSRQRPVRSHGCAVAPEALDVPLQHTPNLQMTPGTTSVTFEEMIQTTKKGIAYFGGGMWTDFQSRNGGANGFMREIVDGKLGPVLGGAGLLSNSSQLWKGLLEIGGPTSVEVSAAGSSKGEPRQSATYSIEAVPARFKDMTVIDVRRR